MKVSVAFILAVLACASGDAPPIPYTAALGQPATFPTDQVANQYVEHYGADGFNVQSGYEGYLVPGAEHSLLPFTDGLELKGHGLISKIFRHLLALGWKIVPKIAIGAVVVVGLFLIGGCVNALICTFTPVCTLSFHGIGVTKETVRSYLTPDKISTTTNFVLDAIRKYKNMYENISNEIETGKKSSKK